MYLSVLACRGFEWAFGTRGSVSEGLRIALVETCCEVLNRPIFRQDLRLQKVVVVITHIKDCTNTYPKVWLDLAYCAVLSLTRIRWPRRVTDAYYMFVDIPSRED